MIYLNNAATSYPKPDIVKETFAKALDALPSGQFRSTGVSDNSDVFTLCRRRLGAVLGIADTERIFFSSGSTDSLNSIIHGLKLKADEVITTVTEHNSVLRPLYNLPGVMGRPVLLPCDKNGYVDPGSFEKEAKKGKAKAFILNHCSNVTGAVQDALSLGEIAKRYGMLFIIDASQSAGCLEVLTDKWQADALAFTGHKSLMGVQGTGGYYVRRGLSFIPLRFGGTGLDSSRILYEDGEYEYEAGTQNSPGIAALSAGINWILEQGIREIEDNERKLTERLYEGLSGIKGVHVIGQEYEGKRGPVVSFYSDSLPPSDLAYILQNSCGIITRAGLHCAPLIHEYIGSGDRGTLRISFSPFNTYRDVDELIKAMEEMS